MLQFENLSIRRGETLLFDGASFQIHPGYKVGLTGANGCGKSSLFSVLLNELVIDKGDAKIPRDWVIAHVAQEAPANARPAIEHVLDGDQEWRDLEEKIKDPGHPRFLKYQSRYEEINGYSAHSRASQLLHGLGFKPEDIEKPAKEFSGGWRVRLNVAKALMCRSDLLLLDEPTNHLDLDAVLWLERWLKRYSGTLILIAHDRDFLDQLTTHTLHIENQRARLYKGNYTAFEKIRTEQLANQQSQYDKQQREIAHMQDFVRRFRAKATKASQAQSRLKALEKMERIAPAHVDSPFSFTIPEPLKNPSPLLSLHNVAVGYTSDENIVEDIEFSMAPGDRVGLVGPNGAGKSTVIKMLAKELKASHGNYHVSKEINIGYFAQHQIEQLQMEHTPMEHLRILDEECNNGLATENQLRRYLGSFGFTGNKATSQVAPFSGGEKSRLALALICYQRPNLLLLDEPTNHLDIEMRQALAVALQDYSGAVILVSHDRHLLKVNSDKLILVANGKATEFQGSVDDYPKWLAEHNKGRLVGDSGQTQNSADKEKSAPKTAIARKEQKRLDAERRKELQPLSSKIKRAERVMEKLESEKQTIEKALTNNDVYLDENKNELKQLLTDQAYVQKELDQAEADWLQSTEAYESLSKALKNTI